MLPAHEWYSMLQPSKATYVHAEMLIIRLLSQVQVVVNMGTAHRDCVICCSSQLRACASSAAANEPHLGLLLQDRDLGAVWDDDCCGTPCEQQQVPGRQNLHHSRYVTSIELTAL